MLTKAFRRPREIDPRDVPFDARPKTAQEAVEEMHGDMRDMPERKQTISCDYGGECGKLQCFEAGICVGGMLTKAELQPKELPPLEEIQRLIRTMPYGDVVAMAEGIGADPKKIWEWSTKGETHNG